MKTLRAWLCRIAGVFSRKQREMELADEIECNLLMHIDDNLRAGMDAEEARRQALMKLGQPSQACKAYAELDAVYGAKIRPDLKKLEADAKAQAQCG